jgi:hypothetical protein
MRRVLFLAAVVCVVGFAFFAGIVAGDLGRPGGSERPGVTHTDLSPRAETVAAPQEAGGQERRSKREERREKRDERRDGRKALTDSLVGVSLVGVWVPSGVGEVTCDRGDTMWLKRDGTYMFGYDLGGDTGRWKARSDGIVFDGDQRRRVTVLGPDTIVLDEAGTWERCARE